MKYDKRIDKLVVNLSSAIVNNMLDDRDQKLFDYWTSSETLFEELLTMWHA